MRFRNNNKRSTSSPNIIIQQPAPIKGWKDNTIIIVVIVAASTFFAVANTYNELLIPNLTASLNNEIGNLKETIKQKNSEIQIHKKKEIALQQSLMASQKSLAEYKTKNDFYEMNNLFSVGNMYPIGFGEIHIGDDISKLNQIYSANKLQKKDGYMSVDVEHKLFRSITYYYEEESKSHRIYQILFMTNSFADESDDVLLKLITESLGSPKTYSKKEFYSWKGNGINLFKDSLNMFLIMDANYRPNGWPSN